jgi:hypothetical protein
MKKAPILTGSGLVGRLFLVGLCWVGLGLGCRRVPVSSAVVLLDEPTRGVVVVRAAGQGNGLTLMEQNAVRQVIETVLFVGLPAAQTQSYRLPLSNRSQTADSFVADFVALRDYRPFFMQIARDPQFRRRTTGGETEQSFILTLNYDAFRRHCEQAGVVRGFGY